MRFVIPAAAAALAIVIALSGCSKPATPEVAAKAFFDQIAAGQSLKAYESSTFAFRAQQSATFFEGMVKELGLNDISEATYSPPEFEDEGRSAKVKAELGNKDGRKLTLNVTLTKESGDWKVFSVKAPRSLQTGLVENPFSLVGRGKEFVDPIQRQPAPDEATSKAMINEVVTHFNDAIQRGDFTEFFEKCSLAWQDQLVTGQVAEGIPATMKIELTEKQKEIGASRLQRAFQPFIDKKVNLDGINQVELIFDAPPRVTTDGLLVMSGSYPTEPYRLIFSMKFTYEVPKWKLFGLDVSLRK